MPLCLDQITNLGAGSFDLQSDLRSWLADLIFGKNVWSLRSLVPDHSVFWTTKVNERELDVMMDVQRVKNSHGDPMLTDDSEKKGRQEAKT